MSSSAESVCVPRDVGTTNLDTAVVEKETIFHKKGKKKPENGCNREVPHYVKLSYFTLVGGKNP